MGFKWLTDLQDTIKTKAAQFKNDTFKHAVIAACALVSAADGEVEPEEKKKVANLIEKNDLLQVFTASELKELFLKYADQAADDFDKIDLMSYVGKLKGNSEQSTMCIRIALVIANADGNFEPQEKEVVAKMCKELNLNVGDFV